MSSETTPTMTVESFDELFRRIWDAYPSMQMTPIDSDYGDSHVDLLRPDPLKNGHSPALTSRTPRAVRRPLPPTPEPSLSRSLDSSNAIENFSTNTTSISGFSPPNVPPSILAWNPSHLRPDLPEEETSSLYPGRDFPALPVYVKDELSSILPPAPPYADSQQSLSSETSSTFPSSLQTVNFPCSAFLGSDVKGKLYQSSSFLQNNEVVHDANPLLIDVPQHPVRASDGISGSLSSSTHSPSRLRQHADPSNSPSRVIGDTFEYPDPGPSTRRVSEMLHEMHHRGPLDLHDDEIEEIEEIFWDVEAEESDEFVNFAFLSNLAVRLRDKVPLTIHVKSGIPFPQAFTGKDLVNTIQSLIHRELTTNHNGGSTDRRAALHIARSLHSQLFFHEVEWGTRPVQDGVEDVYMFMGDLEGSPSALREALPSGIITVMAGCYSPSCGDGPECYAYSCPKKGDSLKKLLLDITDTSETGNREGWGKHISSEVLRSLPDSEINRQMIINKLINKEEEYIRDLEILDSAFIRPLRAARPRVIEPVEKLEAFMDDLFSNVLEIRECNRRLLEILYVRQREQAPVIQGVGDILLEAATKFRGSYPAYVGNHLLAEKRLREEVEQNSEFRNFLESAQSGPVLLDLRYLLNRPSEHFQKYPVLLQAILDETTGGNPDADYLAEAIEAIKNLRDIAQLRTFQSSMGREINGNWEWADLVSPELRRGFSSEEIRRQFAIFELVKGEMIYVKKLEIIGSLYVRPLRKASPPLVSADNLDRFVKDVFSNFAELLSRHRRFVEALHSIQREEHPRISSITAAMLDATLHFREAYIRYISNYPIAAHRIDEEIDSNPAFRQFVENCARHQDAQGLTMKVFLSCPISRLSKYEILLKDIYDSTRRDHPDRVELPEVIDILRALGRETEPGVSSSKQKVQLRQYHSHLVFQPGEVLDLDLLNESRSLVHAGKVLRQSENSSERWTELFVLLLDNYLVMTKPEDQHGVTKYIVFQRPIPLDLLTLVNFTDYPRQRRVTAPRFRNEAQVASTRSDDGPRSDNGEVLSLYPFTLHNSGRLGGFHSLYCDLSQTRSQWKQKLEEATGLRKAVQESNKVFEMETLSLHTFRVAPESPHPIHSLNDGFVTGDVTCSIPFDTADGRKLVAIGCAEGVWIGFRGDSTSLHRVLHLPLVTQCALLEDFGLFLVLSEKQLFAFYIEALAPSPSQSSTPSQVPQKVSGNKEVAFFRVGKISDRTHVIYMRKKGSDSYFHLLEPISEKINDKARAPGGMFGFLQSPRSDWFRSHKELKLPSDAFDLVFLKSRVAIIRNNGFEIMDLNEYGSIAIPYSDPCLITLEQRYETRRPIGILKTKDDGFLLCYTQFGIFVDKHGVPDRHSTYVEWEGNAETVAFHAPYILLFDSKFVEIRHIDNGRLSQMITGTDVRCVWDGRGVITSGTTRSEPDDELLQESHVHVVVSMPPLQTTRSLNPVMQHVFELIPTVPLYLPGPVVSPPSVAHVFTPSPTPSPIPGPSSNTES